MKLLANSDPVSAIEGNAKPQEFHVFHLPYSGARPVPVRGIPMVIQQMLSK